jgi:hypothetical protein
MTTSAAFGFPLAEIGTVIVGLIVLAIAALSYVRAVNALGDLVRKEKPHLQNWNIYDAWYFLLLCGLVRLDINDTRYPGFLWRARRSMIVVLLVFVAFLATIGRFSRGA